MACERYGKALTELAAGAPAAGWLDAHLAGCEGCRQELATLRSALDVVDAELRQLVATEPSPELAARIRQAASETQIESAWRPALLMQALAAAAVLAAVALVLLRGHTPAATSVAVLTPHPPLASGTPLPAAAAMAARTTQPTPPDQRPAQAFARASASARPATPPEPEVLVPPGAGAALLRLAAIVNRQGVASPALAAAGQPSPDLPVPQPIDVRPIDIKPLEIVPLDPAEDSGT